MFFSFSFWFLVGAGLNDSERQVSRYPGRQREQLNKWIDLSCTIDFAIFTCSCIFFTSQKSINKEESSRKTMSEVHCSHVGPHLGTLVPMGTKISFLVPIWSPFFFKVPIFSISGLRTRQKSVQPLLSKIWLLVIMTKTSFRHFLWIPSLFINNGTNTVH